MDALAWSGLREAWSHLSSFRRDAVFSGLPGICILAKRLIVSDCKRRRAHKNSRSVQKKVKIYAFADNRHPLNRHSTLAENFRRLRFTSFR